MLKIPPLSADLIRDLREDNPVKAQGHLVLLSQRELDFYSGQQSLIETLERMLEESAEAPSVLDQFHVFK